MDDLAWLSVWAKSERDERGVCTGWLPLVQHLDDAAGVAGLLIDRWVSPQVLARLGDELPDGVGGVRRLACWLAGVHDVGKASPAFAVQVGTLADYMRRFGLDASPRLADHPQRRLLNHSLVGYGAVRDWLVGGLGFSRGVAGQWASVVGSHHGVPPELGELGLLGEHDYLVGQGLWSRVRMTLFDRATERVGGRAALARYRESMLSVPSQALLTAVVILADWIASNAELFPLRPIATLSDAPVGPDDVESAARLAAGWGALGLPPRWVPRPVDLGPDELLRRRFARPAGSARPVQVAAVELARSLGEPGLVIVEAPMGSGKTEAALMAAEIMAHRFGADGVFVALPTQATSDAMFTRVHDWLSALPGPDGAGVSVSLAHGRAHLNDQYRGMIHRGRYNTVGEDNSDAAVVHWWLGGRKKSGLASFVVGTIDQVLFAGLKSRHLMLRHLALAGKVVVIDEVHAYDVYMSQYLYRVLHWLGAYRVPVVLLSATLPDARRAELLSAYDSGRAAQASPMPDHPGYPVVCASGGLPPRAVALSADRTTVAVDRVPDDPASLVGYLRTHLSAGGCAVVIRNTVTRVQETARLLEGAFGEERVTVNHSRFLACDRAHRDRDLLAKFGPPRSAGRRPDLHIVVASQVVEQSLDIDFDLMVTDLAPVDLVLQRLGRLHRHERDRPGPLRQGRCAVVGVQDWAGEPAVAVRGSQAVYGQHTLLRAGALFLGRDELTLPHDIAPLVQLAYSPAPVGPPSWTAVMAEAARGAELSAMRRAQAARAFLLGEVTGSGSLVGWLRAYVGDTEDTLNGHAQVRDGDESLEVLVIQRDRDGGLHIPDWIDKHAGSPIPHDQDVPYPLARTIAACVLRLPRALSHGGVIDATITELERRGPITSFTRNPLLAGQLVLVLDHDHRTELGGYRLTYDRRRGLLHDRI